MAGGGCTHRSPAALRRRRLQAIQRSETRIIQSEVDVKFWAQAPPSCSAVRPARCPGCGAASREPGKPLRVVGHGLRSREVEGPDEPEAGPESRAVLTRRYRCLACGAVLVVVPRGVARALRYTLDAIGYALALWGYGQKTPEQVRRAVSAATARGLSAPSQWSSLRRWAVRGARIFGSCTPSTSGTLRDRAGQVATWLTSRAPLPTGQVPRDAFFGGRFVHAR